MVAAVVPFTIILELLGGLNNPGDPKFIHEGGVLKHFWRLGVLDILNSSSGQFPSASSVSNNGSPLENLNTNSCCCSLDVPVGLGNILFLGDKKIPGLLVKVSKAFASAILLLTELL